LGYVWYTQPATLVNQVHLGRAGLDGVQRLHDLIDEVIARRADEFRPHGGLLMIHDWRLVSGYESDARKEYLERMRSREPGYLRGAVAIVRDTPLLRMAVQTANMVMAFRTGGTLEMGLDPVSALVRHRVETPQETAWLP
tara:strand:+ start:1627 stop:2046 length:420 start_codon:yes stop_codon:yes gene_type:complete